MFHLISKLTRHLANLMHRKDSGRIPLHTRCLVCSNDQRSDAFKHAMHMGTTRNEMSARAGCDRRIGSHTRGVTLYVVNVQEQPMHIHCER